MVETVKGLILSVQKLRKEITHKLIAITEASQNSGVIHYVSTSLSITSIKRQLNGPHTSVFLCNQPTNLVARTGTNKALPSSHTSLQFELGLKKLCK